MIEFRTNNGITSLKAEGTVLDIESDICILIHALWESYNGKREALGDEFKDFIQNVLPKMPVCEKDTKIRQEAEEAKELSENLKSLTNSLNKLKELLEADKYEA